MSRRKGPIPVKPGVNARQPETPSAQLADLLTSGALPAPGVGVRLMFAGTTRRISGVLDGYIEVDGRLHLRVTRAERHEDGHVHVVRRLVKHSEITVCSWDDAPNARDEAIAFTRTPTQSEFEVIQRRCGDALGHVDELSVRQYDCPDCGSCIADATGDAEGFDAAVSEHRELHGIVDRAVFGDDVDDDPDAVEPAGVSL